MKGGGIPDPVRRGLPVRAAGGAAVGAALAAGWWELLFLPLGASHDGRINGRFGLHVRNFIEHGWSGSDWLASLAPYSAGTYNHHPPLLNGLQAAVGWVFGQGEWQLHSTGFLAGLATAAGMLWLARELGLGAWASVLSLALTAFTPMFWIYARLGLGVSIMTALTALWARWERTGKGGGLLPAAAAAAAFSSWMGAALAVLTAGMRMRGAAGRKAAVLAGAAGLAGAAAALAWALATGGASELAAHAASRLRWPEWSALAENYRWFYGALFPWWFRWLIAPALAAALADRRTRKPAAAFMAALGVWTLAAPAAALLHDYWTFPLLVPVFLGWTAALGRAGEFLAGRRAAALAGAALLMLASASSFARLPDYRDAYFRAPSEAGALLREAGGSASGQLTAWVAEGVDPVPRWVSYYWDLPVSEASAAAVEGGSVRAGDLVLVRLDRLPRWMHPVPEPFAQRGRYALVTGAALRERAGRS